MNATIESAENWRVVPSMPDYEVSDTGTVRYVSGKHLRQYNRSRREHYKMVRVHHTTRSVHSLVMEAFVGKRPPSHEINHINGNKSDNRLSNLEYVTHSQNIKHAYDIGLCEAVRNSASKWWKNAHLSGRIKYAKGNSHHEAKLTVADIPKIRALFLEGKSNYQIAAMFGVARATIRQVRVGKTWKHVQV